MAKGKRFIKGTSPIYSSNTSSYSDNNSSNKKNNCNIIIYRQSNGQFSLNPEEIIPIYLKPVINDHHPINYKLNFKNKKFVSKLRTHEKKFRGSKNIKNMSKDLKDSLSYKIYSDLEVGPSIYPHKKYCDITGFKTNYSELNSGIRYFNGTIFKIVQEMPQPIKDQYLNIRKALIRLK